MRYPARSVHSNLQAYPSNPRRPSGRARLLALAGAAALLAALLPGGTIAPVLASHTPTPTAVTIAGNLQSELGCPGDWQPECANTHLTLDAEDQAWQGAFALPAGNFEYKAPLNGTWDENYGANATADGANIALNLADPTSVKFYYSHETHWVTDNFNKVIAVAPGNFQSELGCAGDWDPSCLRSWLQDPDGDGTYTFATDDLPAGDYEGKVALNETWDVNYGAGGIENGSNIAFTVDAGDTVTFSYVAATHVLTIDTGAEPPDPDAAALARHSLREDLTDEVFYFVLPDRFDNGSAANDQGGLIGDKLVTGLDPTDKGFYHGGDIAGLLANLDYIEDLGTTAVWMAPLFKNRPVQGTGANASAGYHGYWITDFTQLDPHFGSNAELASFVDAAHARGIKVFFDIITNHTADVIDYEEGQYNYRDKGTYPYVDADGVEFDDRDYAGTGTFPALELDSFPYSPVFRTTADETVKAPVWLNDPIYYHNRGDSTFAGESANYGDFVGLDDLFTEQPAVQDGMIDIYETWITEVGIDGYRIDTAKHVNMEFWQAFSPALQQHAADLGNGDFFMFGEVFDSNPAFMSTYTTEGTLQATLDFGFQSRAQGFAAFSSATDELRDFFAQDDYYTDADSNAYSLPTFLGNHDMGRIGRFVATANPGASDEELLARDRLAHTLMYLVRGMPVVYYGDEQGFTGDGGDKDARQDMMPSQVASYNDDDLIATSATTADANFDQTHPIYTFLADLAALKSAHPALQEGAQVHRYSTGGAGIYAFSRIDATEGIEYVVALNNSETEQTQAIQTYGAASFTGIWPVGGSTLTTDGSDQLTVTVPPLSAVVYRADAVIATDTVAPDVTIVAPAEGSDVLGRVQVGATLSAPEFAEVTFAVKAGDATEWSVIGTDDNAPYRVYYDVSDLPAGTPLQFKAVAMDQSGNLDSDGGTAVVGEEAPPGGGGGTPDYAVVHYQRPGGDYDGWGFHFWGDIDQTVDWTNPVPLAGEDDYGPFAWVKLKPNAQEVGFIPHMGDTKDPGPDRFFNPSENPEIWLKQGDLTVYESQAEAQGFVDIRYQRPDGDYTGWGLHLWGDAIADGVGTTWDAPRLPDEVDDYGAHWIVPIKSGATAASLPVNFIVHKGDVKDPGPDQSLIPSVDPAVWIQSGDETIHTSRGSAEDFAVIHYHRADGDYGDPSSSNYQDFWGVHTWAGHLDPDPEWTSPIKPVGTDRFGPFWKLDLDDGATQLAYILHRGDTKDPGPDQFLDLVEVGHEAWYLSGHIDTEGNAKYLLPVQAGGGLDANLAKQKAHWLTADIIAWNIDPLPGGDYAIHSSPTGGLAVESGAITGGQSIPLSRIPGGLSDELKAKWPHLATYQAFRIVSADLEAAKAALTGQVAVSASDDTGALRIATGVQIPGVLDDLYAYDGDLGVTWAGAVPTIRLWAPTAKSVVLKRFADATTSDATDIPMTRDDATGTWSVAGQASWKGQFYLFDVEVYAPTIDQVAHNLVTDPYSFALAANSTRTQIVDLADPALAPSGWDSVVKPSLARPEDIALYELHVRDFSINDPTVPAAERGTYKAFTRTGSDGMQHLADLADAGLTHVHLLPVFDIATVNENRAEHEVPPCDLEAITAAQGPASSEQQACVGQVRGTDGFNWGYDPWHYTTPEGSYATDPAGAARTVEFRSMVQSLNETGLRVVMDVVYNHTNASGQAEKSVLDRIVPGYYHRLLEDGAVANSTCCANTATEHAMMEKLMVDSIVTWARDYKVDGFRFDLMGHHSKANMLAVRAALDELTLAEDGVDGSKIYVYGEGWNFGEVANNARFVQATQLEMDGTGIGTFNDRLRDAVRGGGPFDGDQRQNQGFGSGLFTDPNEFQSMSPADQKARLLLLQDQIKVGLTGNLKDFEFVDRTGALVTGAEVDYNGSPVGYTSDPQEAITYVEAHDNETLFDILAYKLPQDTSREQRARAQVVALSTVALGQGVPFFHAGTELLRSKSLDRNSFDSGDWFNRIFFDKSANNFGVGLPRESDNGGAWSIIGPILENSGIRPTAANIAWTDARLRELLEIRASSRLFRLGSAAEVSARLAFANNGPNQIPGLIVMRISDTVGADLDPNARSIVVVLNASDTEQTIAVSGAAHKHYRLHDIQQKSSDKTVGKSKFKLSNGSFTVPARTTAVFVEAQ